MGKLYQMPTRICMVYTDTLGKALAKHLAENCDLTLLAKICELFFFYSVAAVLHLERFNIYLLQLDRALHIIYQY